jgi:DNA-binding transcriptional LysR family regulator
MWTGIVVWAGSLSCATCMCFSRLHSSVAWPRRRRIFRSRSPPSRRPSQTSNIPWACASSIAVHTGVVPTVYGQKLLKRGTEAFDALKLGMRDIESLLDPGAGDVAIGADMSYIAGGFLSALIEQVSEEHPNLAIDVVETTTTTAAPEFRELRERKVDLMLGRLTNPLVADDLKVERLFDESIVVVASAQSPWARRRKIELEELKDAPWILAPAANMARTMVEDAFRARGLTPPRPRITTYSMQLRIQLLATERYVTLLTDSKARYSAKRWSLKTLPVNLGPRLPVVVVTLKDRTLTPAVELSIKQVRAMSKAMISPPGR